MKRILLFGVMACALTAAPLHARPNGNSRSAPAHVQRSTITRVTRSDGNRFASQRSFNTTRNFNTARNFTTARNVNVNRTRNWNTSRNFNAARRSHRNRTRVVYVNYGYPWYGFGYGCGYPYYSSYCPYYGYGPSVSFNFNNDPYSSGGYGYGSDYYSNGNYSNGYYSNNNNAQPAYRDGNYNVGNASIISRVQEQLRKDGYYRGDVDGALGSRTHYAIRAYQRDHGLETNGTVTEELLRTMGLR
ncbi:MAG: localization factor PodJL [Verrucomicrobiota bacterium]|jgi:hypothetical protein